MQESELSTPYVLSDTFGPAGDLLLALARRLAIVGGLVFIGLVVMLVVSIVGRKLFGFVVPGDVEVLQMLAACAAATFFPYCHLRHGDIKVDFFTHRLPRKLLWVIDAIGSLLVGLFGALLAWRTWAGAMMLRDAGETSMILAWPVWIPQALMVPGFVLLAVAGGYLFIHQMDMARGRRP
ncbi:MAG: TRAP transporter small permease [Gammaproteobacteria bacterium]|nr:TRAP transporter small permease [Gammaproteobacteria bacterium]MBU1646571.1 TRAP transporter small permease [Gammaproteobacteria bacterium]MBU1972828.1 TRAP transporter small permease [Gammaproteobacteria bacterium]